MKKTRSIGRPRTKIASKKLPLQNALSSLHQRYAQHRKDLFWGNALPPTNTELAWIESFGKYNAFNSDNAPLANRLSLEVANLRDATRIIVFYHYLHRGRTMAQLPYWVLIDGIRIGVILYSLPRLSVALDGIRPMNMLELARMWISPDVQGKKVRDSSGKEHSLTVASCAVGQSLTRVRADWKRKYPNLPDIGAVVSWADQEHHEGGVYRASNFLEMGTSGGAMHGSRTRLNGGRDQMNPDYAHLKTRFMYRFRKPFVQRRRHEPQNLFGLQGPTIHEISNRVGCLIADG